MKNGLWKNYTIHPGGVCVLIGCMHDTQGLTNCHTCVTLLGDICFLRKSTSSGLKTEVQKFAPFSALGDLPTFIRACANEQV